MDVALPTLAVVCSWLCIGALLAGCGVLTRRLLLRIAARPAERGLLAADLWLGLGALAAYLQIWSLVAGLGSAAVLLLPIGAGLVGIALGVRGAGPLRLGSRGRAVLALPLLGALWLANRALAPAYDYDLGLYHLNVIRYALDYPAIPGLANLHERLGAGDAHLLLVAFLEHWPWGEAAPHLANGLLVSMLFVDLGSRFVRPAGPSFANRVALLLVPATVAIIGTNSGYRLSSPNLDLAAYVLVAVGALYAAECVEQGFRPTAALASSSAFALAATTRPLYWVTAILAGVLVFAFGHERGRPLLAAGALPAVLLAGWIARQAVLSGYPFFPTTVAGLPVDWRVSAGAIRDQNRLTDAWARWPATAPDEVFASWHWLTVWLRARTKDLDVIAPLALLAALVPALAAGSRDRARPTAPMLAVVLPALATLAVWFFVAPDPRFAFAPIWLVPIALVAWALPSAGRLPASVLLLSVLVAGALAALGVQNLGWYLLAAFDLWALAAIAARFLGGGSVLAHAAVVTLALAPIGVIADRGAFSVIAADRGGPLGTGPTPTPALAPFQTTSGLQLTKPVGQDRCWGVTLCAPEPDPLLRLRGAGVRDGFAVDGAGGRADR